jgi:hypothetical protein
MAHPQRFVINEDQIVCLVIHIAAETIQPQNQVAVGNFVIGQKLTIFIGVAKEAAIVGGQIERSRTAVNDGKEFRQPIIEVGAIGEVMLLQL